MRLFSFAHTRTDTIPPEQLAESLQTELEALHKVTVSESAPSNYEVMPTALARLSRILSILSRQADVQTRANLVMQDAVVQLTKRLYWLTAALGLIALAQIALAALQLKEAKTANRLSDYQQREKAAEEAKKEANAKQQ